MDGLAAAGFSAWVPELFNRLPLAEQQMGWLVPAIVVMLSLAVLDRYRSNHQALPEQH